MDRLFTTADAFSVEPLGAVEIGGRRYDVPPLTRARFLRVQAFGPEQLLGALFLATVGGAPRATRAKAVERLGLAALQVAGPDGLALLERLFTPAVAAERIKGLADVIEIVVPGLDAKTWREHGTHAAFVEISRLIADGHDWRYVAEQMGLDDADDDDEADGKGGDEETALLLFCQHFGHSVEQLLAMRIEGFYRTMATATAILQRARGVQRDTDGSEFHEIPAGFPLPLDGLTGGANAEARARLDALTARAEGLADSPGGGA